MNSHTLTWHILALVSFSCQQIIFAVDLNRKSWKEVKCGMTGKIELSLNHVSKFIRHFYPCHNLDRNMCKLFYTFMKITTTQFMIIVIICVSTADHQKHSSNEYLSKISAVISANSRMQLLILLENLQRQVDMYRKYSAFPAITECNRKCCRFR